MRAHLWNRKKKVCNLFFLSPYFPLNLFCLSFICLFHICQVYDLIFRLCSCNCGHGFLTREEDLDPLTKTATVKKSKSKVALKPELKNDMVKKKPAFHWNRPPKPEVKTTFFEVKRDDFRDFEVLGHNIQIPGLQISDFTVSRARVRGRSRKVSLDENSVQTSNQIELCASKSEVVLSSSLDSGTNSETNKQGASTEKFSDPIVLCAKENIASTIPATDCVKPTARPEKEIKDYDDKPMQKQEPQFQTDIFYSSSEEEPDQASPPKLASITLQCARYEVDSSPRENSNTGNSKEHELCSSNNDQVENCAHECTEHEINLGRENEVDHCEDDAKADIAKDPTKGCVGEIQPGHIERDIVHLEENWPTDEKWPTLSDLIDIQKELADARAKKIAYMTLIMALDNVKLGITM